MPIPDRVPADFMATLQYWFNTNCEDGRFLGDYILMSQNDYTTLYNYYTPEARGRSQQNFPEPHILYKQIPVISAPHVQDGAYYWDRGISVCEVCHQPLVMGREYAKLKRFGHDIWVCAPCVSLAESHLTILGENN